MILGTLPAGRYAILPAITDEDLPAHGLHVIANPADHFNRFAKAIRQGVHSFAVRKDALIVPGTSHLLKGTALNTPYGPLNAGTPLVIAPIGTTETNGNASSKDAYNWIVFEISEASEVRYEVETIGEALEPLAELKIGNLPVIHLNMVDITVACRTVKSGTALATAIAPYMVGMNPYYGITNHPELINQLADFQSRDVGSIIAAFDYTKHQGDEGLLVNPVPVPRHFDRDHDALALIDEQTGEVIGLAQKGYPTYDALKLKPIDPGLFRRPLTEEVDPSCREALRQFDSSFTQALADAIDRAEQNGTGLRLHRFFIQPNEEQEYHRLAA